MTSIEVKCERCMRFFRCMPNSQAAETKVCSVCYDKEKKKVKES